MTLHQQESEAESAVRLRSARGPDASWSCPHAREAAHAPAGSGEGRWLGVGLRRRAAPLILYFDTSALVKLVVVENDSDAAAELWHSAAPVAASILTYPEGRAALATAKRAGRLSGKAHRRAVTDFGDLQGGMISLGIDTELAHSAGALAEEHGLCGYDAVHLATALELNGEAVVVTWDGDLGQAASKAGLGVAGLP